MEFATRARIEHPLMDRVRRELIRSNGPLPESRLVLAWILKHNASVGNRDEVEFRREVATSARCVRADRLMSERLAAELGL